MKEKELYEQLKEAYSDENLNKITGKLIELYKARQYNRIREISNKISAYNVIDEEKISKCFSKLIMLYHPDKGEFYRKEIEKSYNEENIGELTQFSHILLLQGIDKIASIAEIDEDIEYSPEYEWEDIQDGYKYFSDADAENENLSDDLSASVEEYEKTFYNAVKIRMYGNPETEFPPHYLEDFEDIELAESEIELLDGVEYCKHAKTLDLSGNRIADITDLWGLGRLEELYLADNQISLIDALSNLLNLKIVDLSNNEIDDISPLFNLRKLEYVNIVGNKIPRAQIDKLTEKEIVVIH